MNKKRESYIPEKTDVIIRPYAHTFANRRYGTVADDLFDQNFVEIKGTVVEGSHSIYIENWRSTGNRCSCFESNDSGFGDLNSFTFK